MAQVTPTQLGLDEFSPQGMSEKDLLFIIAYYGRLMQTGGLTFSGEVEVKNDSGNPVPVAGSQADDIAVTANPLLTAGVTADPAALPANTVAGRSKRLLANLKGIQFVQQADSSADYDSYRPYSLPAGDWSYAAAAGGITNTTTAVTIKAAGGGAVRNYITGIQMSSTALGAATEFAIRDGAAGTVLWRTNIGTAGLLGGRDIVFPTPIRGSANTLLEVITLTASITGAVYFDAQGYSSAV